MKTHPLEGWVGALDAGTYRGAEAVASDAVARGEGRREVGREGEKEGWRGSRK